MTGPTNSHSRDTRATTCHARAAAVALFLSFFGAAAAQSHDWYDHECCHDQDCAPVPIRTVEMTATGYRITLDVGDHPMIGGPSVIVIPYADDRVRLSADSNFHLCIIAGYEGAYPMCIYVPGVA